MKQPLGRHPVNGTDRNPVAASPARKTTRRRAGLRSTFELAPHYRSGRQAGSQEGPSHPDGRKGKMSGIAAAIRTATHQSDEMFVAPPPQDPFGAKLGADPR